MRHHLPLRSAVLLLVPFVGACAAQATVSPPAISGQVQVDANGQPVDPNVGAGAPGDTYVDNDPSALTDFHAALDPHGTWVDDPTYGTVWIPNSAEVGSTYAPYSTAGHWAYDNDDYVWVSDYDWGWAPYHYGRWVESDRGWAWIPGRTYRGAWVTWGADDGYGTVGWAPMAPEFVWRGGVAVSYTYSGPPHWSYVPHGDVFASNVGGHVLTGSAAAGVSGNVHPTGGSPAPGKLGFSGSQIPSASGSAGGTSISKAKNFGSPTTAGSLGGKPPTRGVMSVGGPHPGPLPTTTAGTAGAGGRSLTERNDPKTLPTTTTATGAATGRSLTERNDPKTLPTTTTATGAATGRSLTERNDPKTLPTTTTTTTSATEHGRNLTERDEPKTLPTTTTTTTSAAGRKKLEPTGTPSTPPKGGTKGGTKGGSTPPKH